MAKSGIIHNSMSFFEPIPRKSFGKTEEFVKLPDLISVQSKSFNDFVQLDFLPKERNICGLEKILKDMFPVESPGKIALEYVSYELGDWACLCGSFKGIEERYSIICSQCKKTFSGRITDKTNCVGCKSTKIDYKRCKTCHSRVSLCLGSSVQDCRHSGKTFSLPLKVRLKLIRWEADDKDSESKLKDIKIQDVFFCSFPVMSDLHESVDGRLLLGNNGTFIINGKDRVVVSQIHRAPGVLFIGNKKTKDFKGELLPSARLIPARGAWLDFEFDSKDLLWVKIDKKRKLLVTTFLQALGYSTEDILSLFYKLERIIVKDGSFYRPVDQSLLDYRIAVGDLPKKMADIITPGMRVNNDILKKLKKEGLDHIRVSQEYMNNRYSARKLIDFTTGEVIAEAGSQFSVDHIRRILEVDGCEFDIVGSAGYQFVPSVAVTLAHDSIQVSSKAVAELYSRLRTGDLPSHEIMVQVINDAFFNPRYYDLSKTGRVRINRKLSIETSIDTCCLTKEDIVLTIKYLLGLKERGEGQMDNPDSLANRCIRLVGELIQNQLYTAFSRIEKIVRERFRLQEITVSSMPYDFINVKPLSAVLNSFFCTGQLSQFMDQTNPLAEMAHKRRLSALGPGGMSRDAASLEVRDVQPSHYGRICAIETPDGHNIGLISSLASYANVNELGFLETPLRIVKDGQITNDVVMVDAFQESGKIVADPKMRIDSKGKIITDHVMARCDGEVVKVEPKKVDFVDASLRQLVSVATALIPFLENDDANRALMGSNMQRQAVPLIKPEAPIVGTGMEIEVGAASKVVVSAKNAGIVRYVSSDKIVIEVSSEGVQSDRWIANPVDVYDLKKFNKSSHNTWVHQSPIVKSGDYVARGDIISDGSSVVNGELALGKNVLVAFMPFDGYNFEDAIALSKRLVYDNVYTSVHIEEFTVEARDTKLGAEEITKDVPNVHESEVQFLDDDGIVKIGTRVKAGDIIVGKITLKGDVQVSAEEKLLRAIFGEKSREVRDTSFRIPPGVDGTVVDVKIFSRSGIRKDKRYKDFVDKATEKIDQAISIEIDIIAKNFKSKILEAAQSSSTIFKGMSLAELDQMTFEQLCKLGAKSEKVKQIKELYDSRLEVLKSLRSQKIADLRRGDELPNGVIRMIRVYVAMKRHISVGDKLVGRHGNKGVASKLFNVEDMPYLANGKPVDMVLNPLGCPGRMNLGQVLETMFGMACKTFGNKLSEDILSQSDKYVKDALSKFLGQDFVNDLEKRRGIDFVYDLAKTFSKNGFYVKTPVFDGANYDDVCSMLETSGLSRDGKCVLYDGRTGEPFGQRVMVGYMYMMKLNHMVDDKIHARSVGPYSLITQQPLGGKAKGGGQRLGEMEVWALMAHGAAYTLQEMLTIKSDDMIGRARAYDAMVHGDEVPAPGLPESFNVLVKELQSLGLQVDLFESDRGMIQ